MLVVVVVIVGGRGGALSVFIEGGEGKWKMGEMYRWQTIGREIDQSRIHFQDAHTVYDFNAPSMLFNPATVTGSGRQYDIAASASCNDTEYI